MYMGDIKLLAKNKNKIAMEKCVMLIMKSGKRKISEEIEQHNQE